MNVSYFTSIERLLACLPQLGFERAPGGGYRLGELSLRLNKPWLTLQLPLHSGDHAKPLYGWLMQPGLWKYDRAVSGECRRFDLPLDALVAADVHDETADLMRSIVDWALATSAGEIPSGWLMTSRQPHALATECLPISQRDMVLQHDRYICRGAIIHDDRRLALRMPILRRFRGDLGEPRKAWLSELLTDAQDRCPMVRLGLDSTDAAVDAVVDLTGCPEELIETVSRTGRDALCWTVAWLVSSVDLLADPAVVSEALQISPARA